MLFVPSVGATELDDARLSRIPAGNAPLRWENVFRRPQWIAGVKPRYSRAFRVHYVDLQPGQETKFRVPPQGYVRVAGLGCGVPAQQVEMMISNGSGLYRQVPLVNEPEGDSLIAVPGAYDVSLARVICPPHVTCGVQLAIFTSRYLPLDFVPGYACPTVWPSDPCESCELVEDVRMQDSYEGPRSGRPFWRLSTAPVSCDVKGPSRLEIESRFLYSALDRTSQQQYSVDVRVDGAPLRTLEFETTAEAHRHVQIKRCEVATSRRQFGYIDVPPGEHRITFASSADLICRVATLTERSYANPRLNGRFDFPRQPRVEWSAERAASIWDLNQSQMRLSILELPDSAAAQLRLAQRSARDNRFERGGLNAAMLMRRAAAGRPDKLEIRSVAEDIRTSHSFYRAMLPTNSVVRPHPANFLVRRIRLPGDETTDVVMPEQIITDVATRATTGLFVAAGQGADQALTYQLPTSKYPTLLRVAVDKSTIDRNAGRTQFVLELDGRRMRMDLCRQPELALGQYSPSAVETALSAADWKFGNYNVGTLGGPLTWKKMPAPMTDTGNCELVIPAGTRNVRLWTESSEESFSPLVALAYRASRTYQLSEQRYLEMVRQVGIPPEDLVSHLLSATPPQNVDGYALMELWNHWLPLARMMRSQSRFLEESVQPRVYSVDSTITASQVHEWYEAGAQSFAHEQWASAIEHWSQLESAPVSEIRRLALTGRVAALEKMGDDFILSRELRGLFFFDPDPAVRDAVYRYQIARLAAEGELAQLENWACAGVLAMTDGADSGRIANLGLALLDNGRFDFAAQVLTCVPKEPVLNESLLSATYRIGWWRTYDRTLQTMAPDDVAFWNAQRQLRWGEYAAAKQSLQSAGPRGAAFLHHLNAGETILNGLRSADEAERREATLAWEAWQADHPGPRHWRLEGSLVESCSGTASVRSIDRNLYGQYFLAKPRKPLRLLVQGPVNLRFEARPQHAIGSAEPLDDWIRIASPTMPARRVAVTGNRPTFGLQITDNASHRLGTNVPFDVQVPAGRHTIEISCGQSVLAARVSASRPTLPSPVLPVMTRETVRAVRYGAFGTVTGPQFDWRSRRSKISRRVVAHLIPADCDRQTVDYPYVQTQDQWCGWPICECDEYPSEASAKASRVSADVSAEPSTVQLAANEEELPAPPVLGGVGVNDGFARDGPGLAPKRLGGSGPLQPAKVGAAEDPELAPKRLGPANVGVADDGERFVFPPSGGIPAKAGATNRNTPPPGLSPVEEMARWVEIGESDAERYVTAMVAANRIIEEHPDLPRLRPLRARLLRMGRWESMREFQTSAGVTVDETAGWNPESPVMRARKAMIVGNTTADAVVDGTRQITLSVRNTKTSAFTLDFSRPQVGFLRSTGVEVRMQIDGGRIETIALPDATSRVSRKMLIGEGDHRIRLWQSRPVAGNLVLVDISKAGEPDFKPSNARRTYWLAERGQPLSFQVDAPAWVRIDHRTENTTRVEYRTVASGTETIALRPLPGRDRAAYRVFVYRKNEVAPPAAAHFPVSTLPVPKPWFNGMASFDGGHFGDEVDSWSESGGPILPVTESWGDELGQWSLAPAWNIRQLEIDNQYPLNHTFLERAGHAWGYKDGTMQIQQGFYQRNAVDEGNDREIVGERFFESSLTHYLHNRWIDRHTHTRFVFRQRDLGGPTYGLQHDRYWRVPGWRIPFERRLFLNGRREASARVYPFNVHTRVFGFLQQPGTALPGFNNQTEWAYGGNLSATRRYDINGCVYRTGFLRLHARDLSLKRSGYTPGTVDQDIYTPWKREHPYGYSIGQRIVWDRRLDRQWWARANLRSNTHLNPMKPDSVAFDFGQWGQTGWLQWGWSYRVTEYQRDRYRDADFLQQLLNFDAQWEHWFNSGRRIELGAYYRHDLTQMRHAYGFQMSYYFSRGRGYLDIPPQRMRFRDVRHQLAIPNWLEN